MLLPANVLRLSKGALGGLAGLGAAVLLVILSSSRGASGTQVSGDIPPLCGAWHRATGEGHPIDLERLNRSYADLKAAFAQSLSARLKQAVAQVALPGYEAGFPACRTSDRRRHVPPRPLPAELLGKKLLFVRVDPGRELALPEWVTSEPDALLFVAHLEKPLVLGEIARRLGRSVELAPPGLAQALGVRCAPASVTVSPGGEVEVHENP